MFEDVSKDRLSEGITNLLFGPVYLVSELVGSLVPGAVFFMLLLIKHNALMLSLFGSAYFGYRTKILVALFLSYVFGKMLNIPNVIAGGNQHRKLKKKDPKQENERVAQAVVANALIATGFYGKHRGMDYLVMEQAQCQFYQSTGFALLVGSFLRGDGIRLLEAAMAILMIAAGYFKRQVSDSTIHSFLGVSIADLAARVPSEHWGTVAKMLSAMFPGTAAVIASPQVTTGETPPST